MSKPSNTKSRRSTKVQSKGRARKAEQKAAASRAYPFPTKAQIAERIANESTYAIECALKLHNLKAPMCSHVKAFDSLVAKISESKDPTKSRTVVAECRRLATRYTRRLAAEARREMLEADPSLKELAELFSAAA